MDKEFLKRFMAKGMLALSFFVILTTFSQYRNPLLPFLVPVFGIIFGLLYISFQIGYCYYFCQPKAFWWLGATLVGALLLASFTFLIEIQTPEKSVRSAIAGGACLSGLVLGAGVLKWKI